MGILNPFVAWLAVVGLVAASYGAAYWKGRQDGWDKRNEVAVREARETERILAWTYALRQKVTTEVVTQYLTEVQTIEKDREVIREILVPDTCELSVEWVRVHDQAAGVPDAAEGTAGAAAAAQTVADNYLACRKEFEKLKALQSWAIQQANIK